MPPEGQVVSAVACFVAAFQASCFYPPHLGRLSGVG